MGNYLCGEEPNQLEPYEVDTIKDRPQVNAPNIVLSQPEDEGPSQL